MAPVAEETAIVPEPVEQEVVYWEGEPATCEELLDKYVIESKFAAMVPGGTLYVTPATDRQGVQSNVVRDQRYKLWFVFWINSLCLFWKTFF